MSIVGKGVRAAIMVAWCALQNGAGSTQQAVSARVSDQSRIPSGVVFIQASELRQDDPSDQFPRGSQLLLLSLDATGAAQGQPVPLSLDFFAAANPQVSADGHRILFASKKAASASWQIVELSMVNGAVRQITHCASNCVQPSYLPANQIVYTVVPTDRVHLESQIEVSQDDGTQAHSITFGPGRFEVETVLRSGRLLLSANTPLRTSVGSPLPRSLYVVDPDGSGLSLLRRDAASHTIDQNATELADGTILFVRQSFGNTSVSKLAWIRPGALHPAATPGRMPDYISAHEFGEDAVAVSKRTLAGPFGLYRVLRNRQAPAQLIYSSPAFSNVQAVPLAPHSEPLVYHSVLHPEQLTGRLVCLDAYATKDVTSGRPPAHVAQVKLFERISTGEKVLGVASVEADGSFYVALPANSPVRLMLLGSHGQILKQQRSWMLVRPGEDRGCVGCHESQGAAPENRTPMALQRMDTPTLLTGNSSSKSARHTAATP